MQTNTSNVSPIRLKSMVIFEPRDNLGVISFSVVSIGFCSEDSASLGNSPSGGSTSWQRIKAGVKVNAGTVIDAVGDKQMFY